MTWDADTGVVTYRAETAGPVDFAFRVVDPQNAYAEQTFTLDVVTADGPANRPPLIRSVPTSPAILGEEYSYPIDAIDLDGDEVTLRVISQTLGLDEVVTDALTFVPTTSASVDFVVEASDGRGGVATQTFTIDVAEPDATNRAPRITSTPVGPATAEQTWTYTPAAVDPDDDDVTISFVNTSSDPNAAAVTMAGDGSISWTPNVPGITLSGTITADDGRGAVANQTFEITSAAAPDGGVGNAVPRFASSPDGGAVVGLVLTYNALAIDDDGDILVYSVDANSRGQGFAVDRSTGVVTWTPTTTGDVTFTLSADDNRGGVATQTVTVTAVDPNAAPQIISRPTGPAVVGSVWSYSVAAIDADDAASDLTYSLVSATDSTGVRFDADTRTLTWTSATELDNEFVIRVTDPAGAAAEQTFTVTSVDSPANRPPAFRSVPITSVKLDATYRYTARAIDPDGDSITFSLVESPVGMTINPTTGVISWQAAELGVYDVVIGASDGIYSPSTQSFRVTVSPSVDVNQAPVINSTPTGPAIRGNQWRYAATATDPNGDAISWSIDNLADFPAGNLPVFNSATGLITWTPATEGRYDFDIVASDGSLTDGQRFTLTVSGNLSPRFVSTPTLEINVGENYEYQVLAIDPNTSDNADIHARSVHSIDSRHELVSRKLAHLDRYNDCRSLSRHTPSH